jgi:hypothetical protein
LNGLTYWTSKLAAGDALAAVAQAIVDIVPALSGATDDAFVAALYHNGAGHSPDADGLAYWTGELANGRSRGAVADAFLGSLLATDASTGGVFGARVDAAMPATQAAVSLTPITTFQYDVHGNVTVRIDHANSASSATVDGYTVANDPDRDRITRSVFDAHGNRIATEDAEGHRTFASFDANDRAVKQWQAD